MSNSSQQAKHKWLTCDQIEEDLSFESYIDFQDKINY